MTICSSSIVVGAVRKGIEHIIQPWAWGFSTGYFFLSKSLFFCCCCVPHLPPLEDQLVFFFLEKLKLHTKNKLKKGPICIFGSAPIPYFTFLVTLARGEGRLWKFFLIKL